MENALLCISKVILHKNKSRGEQFLWNKIEIWAGFGPVGNTEKKSLGRLRATFEAVVFKFSKTQSKIVNLKLRKSKFNTKRFIVALIFYTTKPHIQHQLLFITLKSKS